jgi:DNA polymerase (family 10)
MDYPDDVRAELDIVIGAVHSRCNQAKSEMTRRICTALANPYVKILAHPTGRRLGEREPYAVDLEEVFQTAARHGKAVEMNASLRADLSDVNARRAAELGAAIVVSTDTHRLEELDNMDLGVSTARRAWLRPDRVINTWPTAKLLDWARSGRATRVLERPSSAP